ncbi:MAG: hypothetical protein WDO18_21245 [Acidobacteriota bacterium]
MKRVIAGTIVCVGLAWSCGFDMSLREYLNVRFWQPFAKSARNFERPNVKRMDTAFAGMGPIDGTPVGKMRAIYRDTDVRNTAAHASAAAALAGTGLSQRDREEIELIDAKFDIQSAEENQPDTKLLEAQGKLIAFLRTATTPEWTSEARGWLAHVYYRLGDQTTAGKMYLDELNRNGSNLSRETLLTSLKLTYQYDGGVKLTQHLEDYFDTPEHAAFAVQVVTNPTNQWKGPEARVEWVKSLQLLEKHQALLASNGGSQALALLSMRTAMRMGDIPGALRVARMIPAKSRIRQEPDYLWMLAGAHYVSRDYAAAEAPLLQLFGLLRNDDARKAAAAYGLCGVYQKTGNWVEQLHFALWEGQGDVGWYGDGSGNITNLGLYWAPSGWDANLLLDTEAPLEAVQEFLKKYPQASNVRRAKYSLAVRLARVNRYGEAAEIYESIGQKRRGPRMRELEKLWADQTPAGKFRFAEYLGSLENGVYYNDALWYGLQRYALQGDQDAQLTTRERALQMDRERRLRDEQEEYWRAYLVLRDVMNEAGKTELGRSAAQLALRDLRRISTARFGREKDIAEADIEVSRWLAGR